MRHKCAPKALIYQSRALGTLSRTRSLSRNCYVLCLHIPHTGGYGTLIRSCQILKYCPHTTKQYFGENCTNLKGSFFLFVTFLDAENTTVMIYKYFDLKKKYKFTQNNRVTVTCSNKTVNFFVNICTVSC